MPPSPPDPSRSPSRDFAQKEQTTRELTAAHIQFRRGQIAEAERAVTQILQSHLENAEAYELLADIHLSRSDYEGASLALKQALAIEPGRASAEAKLARASLRRYEKERLKTTGIAYAASEPSFVRRVSGGQQGGRMAAFASALIPGLGQYLNGEPIKGILIAVVYFLSLLLMWLTLAPASPGRSMHTLSLNGLSWFLLILLTLDWLYAVIDAAQSSQRAQKAPDSDKDGWQV